MNFTIAQSLTILERTPEVLHHLLSGLSPDWVMHNEGGDSFSPYDVIGHLIHGEKTDWVVRAKILLSDSPTKQFEPWDRFAQFEASKGKSLQQLLDEFALLRRANLNWLKNAGITEIDLDKTGIHPALGTVSLRNLLATWVVHDLTHTAQITRVMARQYTTEIGPWKEFFRILSY